MTDTIQALRKKYLGVDGGAGVRPGGAAAAPSAKVVTGTYEKPTYSSVLLNALNEARRAIYTYPDMGFSCIKSLMCVLPPEVHKEVGKKVEKIEKEINLEYFDNGIRAYGFEKYDAITGLKVNRIKFPNPNKNYEYSNQNALYVSLQQATNEKRALLILNAIISSLDKHGLLRDIKTVEVGESSVGSKPEDTYIG